MTTTNDGGPAFPPPLPYQDLNGAWHWPEQPGMSLRDYFAANAKDEDVAAVLVGFVRDRQATSEERANARYIHADNMLAARGVK
jgi:hypothetical protein